MYIFHGEAWGNAGRSTIPLCAGVNCSTDVLPCGHGDVPVAIGSQQQVLQHGFQPSNPCPSRRAASRRFNEFRGASALTEASRRYKVRTRPWQWASKLLKLKCGPPAWIRTTNLTGFVTAVP